MNPRRIVLLGDHKQLAPYAKTEAAKVAWGVLPLEGHAVRGFAIVLLDMQFRMPENIYHAISKGHYNGRVRTHPSTINRPFFQRMSAALS